MIHQCKFLNAKDACHTMKQYYEGLTCRPWNYTRPDDTDWWLVPSTDWPAYQHGKILFSVTDKSNLGIGLYIEKGIGKEVAEAYNTPKARRFEMKSNWMWHKFLRDLRNDSVLLAIIKAAEATNQTAYIQIDGGYARDDFDPYANRDEWDLCCLKLNGDRTFDFVKSKYNAKVIGSFDQVKNTAQLISLLESIPSEHYVWIDLWIYFSFSIDQAQTTSVQSWVAKDIQEKLLKPFSEWVK